MPDCAESIGRVTVASDVGHESVQRRNELLTFAKGREHHGRAWIAAMMCDQSGRVLQGMLNWSTRSRR
jgi:hypothetical protein